MLKTMLTEDGRYAPLIVCDECGRRIDDARQALAVTKEDAVPALPGQMAMDNHVHKGACDRSFEEKHGDGGSTELTVYLLRTINNAGMSAEQLAEVGDELGSMDDL